MIYVHKYMQREKDGKYGGIMTTGESEERYVGFLYTILETENFQ